MDAEEDEGILHAIRHDPAVANISFDEWSLRPRDVQFAILAFSKLENALDEESNSDLDESIRSDLVGCWLVLSGGIEVILLCLEMHKSLRN
jgi:hypothetical protein